MTVNAGMKRGTIKNRVLWLSVVAAIPLALSHGARGDQFMNINFSGDTAGLAPAVGAAPLVGGPVSVPTALGGYDNDSDPNGFGDSPPKADEGTVIVNDAGTMTKAAVLTTVTGNNNQGAIWMDTDYNVTANNFRLSFDIDVLHTSMNANLQTYKLNSPVAGPDTEMIFGMNEFTLSGSSIFAFGVTPSSSSAGEFGLRNPNGTEFDTFFDYTLGDTYHIDIDADYSTDTVSAYVNGTLKLSNYPMRAGLVSNNERETFAFVNGDPTDYNSVALDNITATVPEPTSLGLLAVGGLAALRRCRRSR